MAQYLRLPARVYAAITVTSGAILFAPERFLTALGLAQLRTDHRGWLGFALVAAGALFLTEVAHQLWHHFRGKVEARDSVSRAAEAAKAEREAAEKATEERRRLWIERLHHLASDEKMMLIPFIAGNLRSQRVPMNSATYKALMHAGVLVRPEQVANADYRSGQYMVEVFIQTWAMEHLRAHPELLQ